MPTRSPISLLSISLVGAGALLCPRVAGAQATPCYVAYVHGSGTNRESDTVHAGFGNWVTSDQSVEGDHIEAEWTPNRSPDDTTTNSFTYNSSRAYDPSKACVVYRVGYNGNDAWYSGASTVSAQLNEFIDANGIPDGQLIIIAHSMGGVLVRWIMNNGSDPAAPYYNYNGDYQRIVKKTRYAITIQAPHGGAQTADAIYGEADQYFSDAGGDLALLFGGQDRTAARDTIRRNYMSDAAGWMGDLGRYTTLYTVGGDSAEDDAGEGMGNDGRLQTAWAGVCYRRAAINGWGALCSNYAVIATGSGFPVIGAILGAAAAVTFDATAGDGLVELTSASGTILRKAPTMIAGSRYRWLTLHHNHNQGRFDFHYAAIHDTMQNATYNDYPGSFIGKYGLDLPCSDPGGPVCGPISRGMPPPLAVQTAQYDAWDTRYYSADGDWSVGDYKAECATTDKLSGIAVNYVAGATPYQRPHAALCENSPTATINRGSQETRSLAGTDDRADFGTGDWDVGYTKAECGVGDAVAGISQSAAFGASKILCSFIESEVANNDSKCTTLPFAPAGDARLTTRSGDWAVGYIKNECATNQILKGVSSTSTGELHAILCCDLTPWPH